MSEVYLGARDDERDDLLKTLDFHDVEVPLAGAGGDFKTIKQASDLPFYELRDQGWSSTCMNQAYAKVRGIVTKQKTGRYVSLSGGFAYRRKHTAGEGMALWDIMDLGKNHGLPFELIDPSQKMTESQIIDAEEISYADDVAKLFTDPNEKYVYLTNDFDRVANVINQGYPVLIMLYAQRSEYEIVPKLVFPDLKRSDAAIRHGVCGHSTGRYNDNDVIVIDDSWGILTSPANSALERELKERGQRLITREFFNARVYGVAYIRELNFNFDGAPVVVPPDVLKPRYVFSKKLHFLPVEQYGSAADEAQRSDVIALQNILKYEGIFDTTVQSSGYYGAITARAVVAYQRKHEIASKEEIDMITGPNSVVGPKTIAHLNSKYAQ